MARPNLGTKRHCLSCGTKYYDLDKNPIICPKCGAPFAATAALRAKAVRPDDDEAEAEVDEAAPVDFVSLDEVETEENAAEDVPGDDEEIADIGGDDDTFLEEDEEDDEIDIDIDVDAEDEEP